MIIDEKLGTDYIIGCECDDFFIVKRLSPSVECPHCGKTELPSAMLTQWTLTRWTLTRGGVVRAGDVSGVVVN